MASMVKTRAGVPTRSGPNRIAGRSRGKAFGARRGAHRSDNLSDIFTPHQITTDFVGFYNNTRHCLTLGLPRLPAAGRQFVGNCSKTHARNIRNYLTADGFDTPKASAEEMSERDEVQGVWRAVTGPSQGDRRGREHRATQRFARAAIYRWATPYADGAFPTLTSGRFDGFFPSTCRRTV